MAIYSLHPPPPLVDPIMVMGLAGWGDAASAASDATDWLAEDAQPVVTFDPDAVFDYRSNRPILKMSAGEMRSITWPRMDIVHIAPSGRDVLLVVGNEPDFAWSQISTDLAALADSLGVKRLITLGSVPTPVRHTLEAAAFCTASEARLLLADDEVLMDDFVVPASGSTVFRAAIEEVGIPAIGYWAQVPQYVGRPYHPAIVTLLKRTADQLGVEFDLTEHIADAEEQVERLDSILAERDDAREFVEGLGISVGNTARIVRKTPPANVIRVIV